MMQEQIIRTDYAEVMQKSYVDYAMSVIISRALPDIRDGQGHDHRIQLLGNLCNRIDKAL